MTDYNVDPADFDTTRVYHCARVIPGEWKHTTPDGLSGEERAEYCGLFERAKARKLTGEEVKRYLELHKRAEIWR